MVRVAKANRIEHTIQAPFSSQVLALAFMLFLFVKSNN
jgi:hypothetical protein